MASSIASQLRAINSQLPGIADPGRRPRTRPSVLFDPKEAADIDVRTILPIAVSGLEVLFSLDARFQIYRNTLFSNASLEIDREKMVPKEEERINKSISSYMRLLAGHLQLPAALKTLEYLIRKYQVHVFNVDDLVLCALPYHDTHAFVRIVQLIRLRDKWAFLEGVKTSGAPPPRKVIVQQCIRDKGVLEALCNYASSTKEFGHSRPVVCFCTAVVVEALGSVQKLDDVTVKRVLPFVLNGLNPAMKGGRDDKAGALMVVGLVASRSTLAPKLVNNLIFCIARIAQQDANESEDLPWLRVALMAIISLVQSQSVQMLPEKSLKLLVEIRDFSGVLADLSHDFNIEKFLSVFLETLAYYSCFDDACCLTLVSAIDIIPMKAFVGKLVPKLLGSCVKLSQNAADTSCHEAGARVKQILEEIHKRYQPELCGAIQCFLENSKRYSLEEETMYKSLCLMFDGGIDMPSEISASELWFSLEHPKAGVRQATLSRLSSSGLLTAKSSDSRMLSNVQEAIVRRLHDSDLVVVKAALLINRLSDIISPHTLLEAFKDVLSRCINILMTGTSDMSSQACEVAVLCLESAVLNFRAGDLKYLMEVAKMIFPLLVIFPKTWKVNLRALELAKQTQWPFFLNAFLSHDDLSAEPPKTVDLGHITSFNLKNIGAMAKSFLGNFEEYINWLIECSKISESSKSLFFFIMLHSVLCYGEDISGFLKLFDVCFPVLKHELHELELKGNHVLAKEFSAAKLESACEVCMNELLNYKFDDLNANILIHICWGFLKGFSLRLEKDDQVGKCSQLSALSDLFVFFASSSSKVFRDLNLFLATKCTGSPAQFLSSFFIEGFPAVVQDESLRCLENICSRVARADLNITNNNIFLELLIGFPSLLVPLSCKRKETRTAAMNCIEELLKLWQHFDISRVKNGNDTILMRCISTPIFGTFLGLICTHKEFILSDMNYLPSFMTSMLGRSSDSLMVPRNSDKMFDLHAKDSILFFILNSAFKRGTYAKVMVLSLFKGIGNAILKVEEVKVFLSELLEKRNQQPVNFAAEPRSKLSDIEIEALCLLLEASTMVTDSLIDADCISCLLRALKVDGSLSDNPAYVKPCVATLQNVTCSLYSSLKAEIQDEIFFNLVLLFRNDNGEIRIAAKEALLRINVSCSTMVRLLDMITSKGHETSSLKKPKKRKLSGSHSFFFDEYCTSGDKVLSFLNSLLDVMLLKKNTEKRQLLLESLFTLLGGLSSDEWIQRLIRLDKEGSDAPSETAPAFIDAIAHAQQETLIILEDISSSLVHESSVKVETCCKFNINLLVDCARSTKNAVTRNYVFLLLSAVAKISSEWVSDHMLDLFTVVGESAIKQNDDQSQHTLEDLISTLVPCWLSQTNSIRNLLQVFVKALPQVAEHRRLTFMAYLLRTLGEKSSLGTFLALLFQSLITRKTDYLDSVLGMNDLPYSDSNSKEWEYLFAEEICNQFSCKIWLPCLVVFLEEIGGDIDDDKCCFEVVLALHFILQMLQDTELAFELESGPEISFLQCTLGSLMEKVILRLHLVESRSKQLCIPNDFRKLLKDVEHDLLKLITDILVPSEYFKAIVRLLDLTDVSVRKKTLSFVSGSLKNDGLLMGKRKQRRKIKLISGHPLCMDEDNNDSFNDLCNKIIQLVDCSDDDSKSSVKLVAISCLEAFANVLPSNDHICLESLAVIVNHIPSPDLSISSSSLRCVAALTNVLGSKALPELPNIMKKLLERARDSSMVINKHKHSRKKALDTVSGFKSTKSLSILLTLEAVIEKLGCFLNPYLEDIIKLLVLHPDYVSEFDPRIKQKAAIIRKLIVEKIPVRLSLSPLLKIYPEALEGGDASLSLVFEMLAIAINSMDKSSIVSHHARIFDQCLLGLDIRHQHPEFIKSIYAVEQNVIRAIVDLTMKLTESMFRPLFLRSLKWAECELESNETKGRSIERTISFYNLVNKLADQQRSLFVPYFKYLLEGITRYLTDDPHSNPISQSQKKKKPKVVEVDIDSRDKGQLSPKQWHLRALILSALYKCFLYDSGNMKFLVSSNFQVLLKPIVSQLVAEPPATTEQCLDAPSVEEVDESLVCCLGQMAVTAGSDEIWKQLNHEVLMQTRNEKVRPRILGLKVVKYLMEHLKEEYLVLLPETIPFLSELLEDVELIVKSLAQEIFKELETLSGENLREYL